MYSALYAPRAPRDPERPDPPPAPHGEHAAGQVLHKRNLLATVFDNLRVSKALLSAMPLDKPNYRDLSAAVPALLNGDYATANQALAGIPVERIAAFAKDALSAEESLLHSSTAQLSKATADSKAKQKGGKLSASSPSIILAKSGQPATEYLQDSGVITPIRADTVSMSSGLAAVWSAYIDVSIDRNTAKRILSTPCSTWPSPIQSDSSTSSGSISCSPAI